MGIADDLKKAFFEGYEAGKKDAEFYMLHCGDADEPYTNADRIRSMADEELAKFLDEYVTSHWPCKDDAPIEQETKECKISSCAVCWLDWLKEETNDNT